MARRKFSLNKLDSWIYLDLGIFRNTKLTVFEALVRFLKDKKGLSFKEISLILGKDERNIWTVYNRGCRKAGSSWQLASGREQEKRRRKLN